MAVTDAQLLLAARTAYLALLEGGAQAYSINGRTYSALNLKDLAAEIDRLEAKIARSTRGTFDLGAFGCQ